MRFTGSRPSPATTVAALALVAALTGTALADSEVHSSAVTKKRVKKIARKVANKQITKRAPDLSVASAEDAETLDGQDSSEFKTASGYAQRTDVLPVGNQFTDIATTNVATATRSRVLASASLELEGTGGDDVVCRVNIAGRNGPENRASIPDTTFDRDTLSVAFARVLPAGTHGVTLQCRKFNPAPPPVTIRNSELLAFAAPV